MNPVLLLALIAIVLSPGAAWLAMRQGGTLVRSNVAGAAATMSFGFMMVAKETIPSGLVSTVVQSMLFAGALWFGGMEICLYRRGRNRS